VCTVQQHTINAQSCSIEAVLFDFGGVLAEEGFKEGLMAIARNNKTNPDTVVKKAYELTFAGGFATAQISEQTFWQMLRQQAGVKGTDAVLRAAVLSRFRLRPWMLEIVKKLRAAHVHVAILSDQTRWLDELNERYDFFKWFDRVYNSYYLGKTKQEPTIFNDVVSDMKLLPHQVLFIDDSEDNIERAVMQGLHAILYQERKTFEKELTCFCPFLKFPESSEVKTLEVK
jgi:putative hydrolase of the HAD superfamily